MKAEELVPSLNAMVARLRAHPDVIVEEAEIGGPRTYAPTLAVPNSILAFYDAADGFKIRWRLKPQAHERLKERLNLEISPAVINVWSLDFVLSHPTSVDDVPFYAFDRSHDETTVGLAQYDDTFGEALHAYCLLDEDLGALPVSGTLGDYFDACIQAYGFGSWHGCWASPERPEYERYDFARVVRALFGDDTPFDAYGIPV